MLSGRVLTWFSFLCYYKGADDPVKQIPRLFQFLFLKNGLQEKEIDVAEGLYGCCLKCHF